MKHFVNYTVYFLINAAFYKKKGGSTHEFKTF